MLSLFHKSFFTFTLSPTFRHPPTYTLGLLKLKRSVCCLPFHGCHCVCIFLWVCGLDTFSSIHRQSFITVIQLVICMCTCLYFVVEQIHFSTPSVGYNCYTSDFCICIFCVFRGWINTCLYTVTQCFMYGVWLVWCMHDRIHSHLLT